jgi:hypothetical protein
VTFQENGCPGCDAKLCICHTDYCGCPGDDPYCGHRGGLVRLDDADPHADTVRPAGEVAA